MIVFHRFRELRPFQFPVKVAALAILLAIASVPATASAATLQATPNPVAAGDVPYWILGCGYVTGKAVNIVISTPIGAGSFLVSVDANGCIAAGQRTWSAGLYTIQAWQQLKGWRKQSLMATTYLTVQ